MKTPTCTLTAALAAVMPILFTGGAQAALVSYLSLDTSTGLTLNGDANITSGSQGKFGEALSLDGTGDWASVNAGNQVTGTGERTVSAWVFQLAAPTTSTQLATVAGIGTNSGTSDGGKWDFEIDNLAGGIEVGIDGARINGTGLTGLTGNWLFIVSTLPVAGGTSQNIVSYLNGIVTSTSASATRSVNTIGTKFDLGISANGPTSSAPQYLNGRIDDVAVWSESLTAGEIKGLYDVGMTVDLSYTAYDFDLLKQRHDLATGSTTIDSLEWTYATGLTGPAGLTSGPGGYTLVLDATLGTGLTAIPEPSAVLLGGLGLFALVRRRR